MNHLPAYILLILQFFAVSTTEYGLTEMDGKPITPKPGTKATVFIMMSPECPLCQSYSLTLNNLNKKYEPQGVAFYGIVPGTLFTSSEVKAFMQTYSISFPMYFDLKKQFTAQMKATKTPEVFVLDNKNTLRYRGRIDNWAYELGKKRKVITEHELQDALEAIISNQPIRVTKTEPIGCYIED